MTYATLNRVWRDGDKVEVSMPMSLHSAPLFDSPDVQAVMYGPMVLAASMGNEGLDDRLVYGPNGPWPAKKDYSMPELVTSSGHVSDVVRRITKHGLHFETVHQPTTMQLKPLYQVLRERYTAYFKVNQNTV